MVFVNEFFIFSLTAFLLFVAITVLLVKYREYTPEEFLKEFKNQMIIYQYRNIIYIMITLYILSFWSKFSTLLAIVFFSWAWHSETLSWIRYVKTTLNPAIRLYKVLGFLGFVSYVGLESFSFFKTNLRSFWKELVKSFIFYWETFAMDMRSFWGTLDTSAIFKKKIENFKAAFTEILSDIKVDIFDTNMFSDPKKLTQEDILLQKQRDPNMAFNRVRKFPWKFKYEEEDVSLISYLTPQILVFYNFFKTTAVALLITFIYFLYTIFFFKIQFLKQLSVWFVIGMLYFWLMSGFNFFVKRYQYGKFTSAIQRFWKRTNTYFWLIEGFLILLFFYYYLNSSQEPLYMYDYSSLNQEFLVSLQVIGINVVLLSVVIYLLYFIMLRVNSNSWNQLNLYLLVISVFVFFSFFIETYQFYYLISTFNERLWIFNEEENIWGIDVDNPILRTKHQYLFVCLIAKYWHFLFIFLSWVFFLIKSFERRKVTYTLLGANLQNMILLYVLNFACYLQWFKWLYRRFFDLPYTWFFTSIDNKFLYKLNFELKLLVLNLFRTNDNLFSMNSIIYKSLEVWNVDSLSIWKFI